MPRSIVSLTALSVLLALTTGAVAEDATLPRLHTDQAYVEEVTRPTTLKIDDPMAVFAYVFNSLPERVKVYPTENFYYFSFVHDGKPYGGNLRLEARTRDDGKIHFGYFETPKEWNEGTSGTHRLLSAKDGVKVEKLARFEYRVSYGGKSVVFALNDLSQVKPPAGALGPDETFIGPIFDESGVRFFLVFNRKLKIFLYLLDETVKVADELAPVKGHERILIGKRTGFAFYRDHRLNRKIMIGAFEPNIIVNSYFDGPFDQMPDNFQKDDRFRQSIYAYDPDVKGKIDRYATFDDGARFAIETYMGYRKRGDLDVFDQCATSKAVPAADYYKCFVIAPGPEENGPKSRPLAMQPRPR